MIYEPAEDSFLLEKFVKKFACGKVLDVGTGSGIQALTALRNKHVTSVLAVDKFKKVVVNCPKEITCMQSDLFSKVKGLFDTIVCNPPYLPAEGKIKYSALEGGAKGYEVIERFLNQAGDHLEEKGIILLLFSSLTNKKRVDGLIEENLFEKELLGKKHVGLMEDLFVYRITKGELRKKLDKKVRRLTYFRKGKRGIIHTALYKGKNVAIKSKKKESKAVSRIFNEARILQKVNKRGIGPKLILFDDDFVMYEFVDGVYMNEFLEKASTKKIEVILKDILRQCRILDEMRIQKEEMHRLNTNVVIDKKAVLIDFERAKLKEKTHNVNQFLEFVARRKKELKKKGIVVDRDEVVRVI